MTPDHEKYVLCIDDTGSRQLTGWRFSSSSRASMRIVR